MKCFAILALAAAALAQSSVAPGSTPAGCSENYSGSFEITIVKPSAKRDVVQRDTATTCGQEGILTVTGITNGVMMDTNGRTAYIASANGQFQFDKPVQAGGEYSVGWAVCSNSSLALGGTTDFLSCGSGNFSNLYLFNDAAQCETVNINIIPCSGSTASVSASTASSTTAANSTVASTTMASTTAVAASVTTDGQIEETATATTVAPVSVSTDGQIEATASATSVAVAGGAFHGVNAQMVAFAAGVAGLAML